MVLGPGAGSPAASRILSGGGDWPVEGADSWSSAPSSSSPPLFFMSPRRPGRAVRFSSLGVGSWLRGRWEVGGGGPNSRPGVGSPRPRRRLGRDLTVPRVQGRTPRPDRELARPVRSFVHSFIRSDARSFRLLFSVISFICLAEIYSAQQELRKCPAPLSFYLLPFRDFPLPSKFLSIQTFGKWLKTAACVHSSFVVRMEEEVLY